jgi:hypothetical protein
MSYCSWDQVRRQVRNARASIQAQAPPSALTTIRDFRFDELHNLLFFLANDINNTTTPGIGQMRLYAVDLANIDPTSPSKKIYTVIHMISAGRLLIFFQ